MTNLGAGIGFLAGLALGPWLFFVLLWSFFWKGLALWHSARRKQPVWFIILLIVNTIGVLEIIYLFAVIKLKASELFSNR